MASKVSKTSKTELVKLLKEMGVKVEGNYINKKSLEKVVGGGKGIFYDDVKLFDKLKYVIPEVRSTIEDVLKKLERVPTMKDEVKRLYGTGFISDLGVVAKLYDALK